MLSRLYGLIRLTFLGAILGAFVVFMLVLAGTALEVPKVAAVIAGATIVVAAGDLLLHIRPPSTISAITPAIIIIGMITTSLVITAGVLLTKLDAASVFIGWSTLVVASWLFFYRPIPRPSARQDLIDYVAITLVILLVAFWCRHSATALQQLKVTGLVSIWPDIYYHGAMISQFGNQFALRQGSILFSGQPIGFYHYGSYMLAAALQPLFDVPSVTLAANVFLPGGLLAAGLGAYTLATQLSDRRGGAIAVGLLTVLPDASYYGFKNGFFGFHWLLFTTPGAGYALAGAAISLVILSEWFCRKQLYLFILACILAAGLFMLRAHIFLWFAPALALTITVAIFFGNNRPPTIAIALSTIFVGAIVAVLTIKPLRALWLKLSYVSQFLSIAHDRQDPTSFPGLYAELVHRFGQSIGILVGTILLLPVVLGLFVFIYPITFIFWLQSGKWRDIDVFPLALIVVFLMVVMFAPAASDIGPAANATGEEFQHRAFVLLYYTVAIWSAAYLSLLLPVASRGSAAQDILWLVGVTATSILVGWISAADPGRPRQSWALNAYLAPIPPGFVEAADFVRASARGWDLVALSAGDPDSSADKAVKFAGMTNIPSYLALAHSQWGKSLRQVALERISRLEEVKRSVDLSGAMRILEQEGVAWFVVIGTVPPSFDPALKSAAFVSPEVVVYRIK